MENKWKPCWCGMLMGVLVIVFAWLKVTWAPIALTVLGILVLVGSLINKCCCKSEKKDESKCCC